MSGVISFRLNKDNLREAQALEILEAWCSNGYSVRYVITEALLMLNESDPELVVNNELRELNLALERVNRILQHLGNGEYLDTPRREENTSQSNITDNFVTSIKKAVKPGIKIE